MSVKGSRCEAAFFVYENTKTYLDKSCIFFEKNFRFWSFVFRLLLYLLMIIK